MADKFLNKYRIPSARAVWHNYNGGDYFITICTSGREHYFGEIVNGEMHLNVLGQKMNDTIAEIPTHHPYAKISVYQVMPNHVHLIVCIDETKMKRNAVNTDAAGTNAVNTDAAGTDAVQRGQYRRGRYRRGQYRRGRPRLYG
jgi:putative transposase